MYSQSIKNEDPRLDFYAVSKREATEYDTECAKEYDGGLAAALVFLRKVLLSSLYCCLVLTTFLGWSVLCHKFSFRHRCPVEA